MDLKNLINIYADLSVFCAEKWKKQEWWRALAFAPHFEDYPEERREILYWARPIHPIVAIEEMRRTLIEISTEASYRHIEAKRGIAEILWKFIEGDRYY